MSDHLSSPRALQDPVIDLTDLYFFPVPGATDRLAAVVNAFPGATPGAAFSDAVIYRIRLAPADVDPHGVVRAHGENEVTIEFTFAEPDRQTGSQEVLLRVGVTHSPSERARTDRSRTALCGRSPVFGETPSSWTYVTTWRHAPRGA